MDLPVRKKLPHTVPQWVSDGCWFFVTIKCVPPGKNQLCQMDDGQGRAVSPLTAAIGAHGVTRPTVSDGTIGAQGTARPTSVGEEGACVTRPTIGDGVLAAMKHNHDRLIWHCRLCLLMPDHLHAIISFPREPGVKTIVANWKKFVAVKIGVNWQRDFFDHRLRDHHELQEKTGYILMNPVRKGLCKRAEDWAWVYRPADRPL